MQMSIINDRVDFVRLLLDYGVSLKEFLTVGILRALYNNVRFIHSFIHSFIHQANQLLLGVVPSLLLLPFPSPPPFPSCPCPYH